MISYDQKSITDNKKKIKLFIEFIENALESMKKLSKKVKELFSKTFLMRFVWKKLGILSHAINLFIFSFSLDKMPNADTLKWST